jgi:hypothetical protein
MKRRLAYLRAVRPGEFPSTISKPAPTSPASVLDGVLKGGRP